MWREEEMGKRTIHYTPAGFLSSQLNFLGTVSFTIEQQMGIAWQHWVCVWVCWFIIHRPKCLVYRVRWENWHGLYAVQHIGLISTKSGQSGNNLLPNTYTLTSFVFHLVSSFAVLIPGKIILISLKLFHLFMLEKYNTETHNARLSLLSLWGIPISYPSYILYCPAPYPN